MKKRLKRLEKNDHTTNQNNIILNHLPVKNVSDIKAWEAILQKDKQAENELVSFIFVCLFVFLNFLFKIYSI